MVDKPKVEHGLRLAELLAAVSLATYLSHDVPAESALRDALLAVELARLMGWTDADLSDVYYLALLYHVGCTGAVAAQSRLGAGDDVSVRRWMSEADYADRPGAGPHRHHQVGTAMGAIGIGAGPTDPEQLRLRLSASRPMDATTQSRWRSRLVS